MATNLYLNFEGTEIKGESTDAKHKEWIEVLSWSHGFNQPTSPVRSTAGGGTVERANHSDFSFTKYMDSATDDLLKQCWGGKHIDKATLECYRSDGADDENPALYLKIIMEKVIISNYNVGGGAGDIPVENVSLSYGKVTYEYHPQDEASGSEGSVEPVYHDLTTNQIG
jgi:type VI secretion system secreted protein Hcp